MSFESTRIFKLLSSLDPVMLNRFAKFIHSPYFNVNERITKLFDIIHNALKKGIAVQSKEELWHAVGFAVEYKDIKFRKLCNDLVERFERFLTVEAMEKDEMLKAHLLLKSIKDNEIQELLDKSVNKSTTVFSRALERSSNYHLYKFKYEKELQPLKVIYEKKEELAKTIKADYEGLSKHLDNFYIIEKLRHLSDAMTWNKQYKTNIDITIPKNLQSLIKNEPLSNKIINTYYMVYEILKDHNAEETYFNLKQIAKNHIDLFPRNEQTEIFDALFSYCVKWVNRGNKTFHYEYLDIHDWGIREEYILQNGNLSPTSFRNYVFTGLRMKEFDRVEKYIQSNITLLEESKRSNALHLSIARLEFYRSNFEKVIQELNLVNYNDVWYNLNARTLLLAAYYELDEIDPLYSQMDAFTNFLRREKSLNQRKGRYLNFISYLKRLVNSYGDTQKIQTIKDKLVGDSEVVNKPWLLEKIEEQLN